MNDYQQLEGMMMERLKSELSPVLRYHSVRHTRDVVAAAEQIALSEGIVGKEVELLKVAALFHDAGFLLGFEEHEEKGCRLAREILPGFGYEEEDLEIICGLIMATRVPQQPDGLLQAIICDADLDYLGRKDFFRIGHHLYEELLERGLVRNACTWDEVQVAFMESHQYFTETNRRRRQQMKEEHLMLVRQRLEQCKADNRG